MSASVNSRIDHLLRILGSNPIDLNELRENCFNGISDESNLRALCWRILLDYLPPCRNDWSNLLEKQRKLYDSFVEEILIKNPVGNECDVSCGLNAPSDHPLNPQPNGQWTKFFKDNEIVAQINKDVRRLYPEIAFFQKPTEFPCQILIDKKIEPLHHRVNSVLLNVEVVVKSRTGTNSLVNAKRLSREEYTVLEHGSEAHWQVVERILFVYAKLNPGVKYIQGMNEIIGPIYYVFASDANIEWKKYAEADAYFCFQNLMTEIRDNFIGSMDDSFHGIEYRMKLLYEMVKRYDPQVYGVLTQQNLLPQYFAFRWISLLLSQEFLLPDVIRIWDSLFCEKDKFTFLMNICLCLIVHVRTKILTNDFGANMKLLQNYPTIDVSIVLSEARELLRQTCAPS